jgi:hypothetical protein
MSKFIITRDCLETMYQEGTSVHIAALVSKYKAQIIRANAKGMKMCTGYFGNEDMNIIKSVVEKLKEIFVDSTFSIMRRYEGVGEIIIFWDKDDSLRSGPNN